MVTFDQVAQRHTIHLESQMISSMLDLRLASLWETCIVFAKLVISTKH